MTLIRKQNGQMHLRLRPGFRRKHMFFSGCSLHLRLFAVGVDVLLDDASDGMQGWYRLHVICVISYGRIWVPAAHLKRSTSSGGLLQPMVRFCIFRASLMSASRFSAVMCLNDANTDFENIWTMSPILQVLLSPKLPFMTSPPAMMLTRCRGTCQNALHAALSRRPTWIQRCGTAGVSCKMTLEVATSRL